MKAAQWDYPLFYIAMALAIFGLLMLTSAAIGLIGKDGISPFVVIVKQVLLGGGVGMILLWLTSILNFKIWFRFSILILLTVSILMILVFVPGIGFTYGGASRWINAGPFSFQPSELFKLVFICYISSWLVSRKEEVESAEFGLLPFLIMTAIVSAMFVMQPDIGTLSIIIAASSILFFIGGGRLTHLLLAALVIVVAIGAIVFFEPYRRERVITYFNPGSDIQGSGYQLHQAFIAIGSGGFFGRGFGESVQKFSYLPEAIGDSIFAIIGEEFGFVGSVALVSLFIAFLWRAIIILARVRDPFARLFGSGIVILIVIQSFFNMAALTGVLPLTGIPLAFISQGGSSLAVTLMSVGILLNISKYRKV